MIKFLIPELCSAWRLTHAALRNWCGFRSPRANRLCSDTNSHAAYTPNRNVSTRPSTKEPSEIQVNPGRSSSKVRCGIGTAGAITPPRTQTVYVIDIQHPDVSVQILRFNMTVSFLPTVDAASSVDGSTVHFRFHKAQGIDQQVATDFARLTVVRPTLMRVFTHYMRILSRPERLPRNTPSKADAWSRWRPLLLQHHTTKRNPAQVSRGSIAGARVVHMARPPHHGTLSRWLTEG